MSYSAKMLQHYVIAEASYTYRAKKDDGDFLVKAYDEDKKEVGSITFAEEYVDDDGDYPFGSYKDQPFFEKITSHEVVVNIRDLHVKPEHKGKGIAGELMKRAMKAIKAKFSGVPTYINASPYGDGNNIGLESLVAFYTKFGFKVLKRYVEHRNALLWRD